MATWAALSVNLIGTYLMQQKIDTGLYNYDCVGYFGNQCGIPTPKWRHIARFSWETNLKFVLSARLAHDRSRDKRWLQPQSGARRPRPRAMLKLNDI